MIDIDSIDAKILNTLQQDCALPQRALAEKVGLSQNALWRRLHRLQDAGVIDGHHAHIKADHVGLDLTVFVMIRTRSHNLDWAQKFKQHVEAIPQIVEMHRIGGDWDYMLKVVTNSMAGYDAVYQRLTSGLELETVTGLFSMETLLENRPLAIKPTV